MKTAGSDCNYCFLNTCHPVLGDTVSLATTPYLLTRYLACKLLDKCLAIAPTPLQRVESGHVPLVNLYWRLSPVCDVQN